jgi:hypothetical protein
MLLDLKIWIINLYYKITGKESIDDKDPFIYEE